MEQLEDNVSYMKDFQPLSGAEMDTLKRVTEIANLTEAEIKGRDDRPFTCNFFQL